MNRILSSGVRAGLAWAGMGFVVFWGPVGPVQGKDARVVKRVLKVALRGRNLLKPNGWRAWGKGFERRDGLIVCDNGRDSKVQRGASQTVVLRQKTPRPIVASAWSRAENVGGNRDRDYSLYLDLEYMDGTPLWGQISSFSVGTHGWQQRKVLVLPEKPVRSVTVHLLLRRHSGKAWFRDPKLTVMPDSDKFLLFDGVPVVPESIPAQGFELRDVAANSDYVAPVSGRALGIEIAHRASQGPAGAQFVDVTVRDRSGRDRAVSLVYGERLPPGQVVWFQNPRERMPAAPRREYSWTSHFHVGSNGNLSRYPFAAVSVGGQGYGLGIDPGAPAFYRVGYNSGTRQLFVIWDLGLTPEHPAAHVRFCRFRFAPGWGFRAALARWYRIFPEAYRVRVRRQGLWMPFARISKVQGWQDFGFRFKEGTNEIGWDDAHGILTFRYTEPMTWWMRLRKDQPRTLEAALAEVRRRANSAHPDRRAQALLTSGMFDDTGKFTGLFRNTPWCNGVVWSMNSMPGIRGSVTDFKNKWNPHIVARYYGPRRKANLDGEYIDSSEGYVTRELDFRRDHFSAATTPLAFSWESRKPGIFRGLVAFEYVRAIARDVHAMGKLMMANGAPTRLCWLAPLLDVMGTETNWNPGGKWRPMSDAEMLYRRALAGGKPYCFLMNTDFSKFPHALVEKYMMRAAAYGMFPGFFSADASTGAYFTRPALYNRDRDLFRKYVPLCKRLAEAGWRPITAAWAGPAPAVHVERFGTKLLTVFNDGKAPVSAEVLVPAREGAQAQELVSGKTLAGAAGARGPDGTACVRYRLALAPEHLAVLELPK